MSIVNSREKALCKSCTHLNSRGCCGTHDISPKKERLEIIAWMRGSQKTPCPFYAKNFLEGTLERYNLEIEGKPFSMISLPRETVLELMRRSGML